MGPICRPSYSGSRGTEVVEFIQCVDGQDAQMHKIWCIYSDGVTREVQLKAQIDIGVETFGHFLTQYFAQSVRRIPVISQISINGSVKLWGIPAYAWVCGLMFIENAKAPTLSNGWGVRDTSNQN